MEIKTSELTGKALDYAVALVEGVECDEHNKPIWFDADGLEAPRVTYSPSTNWSHGGPLMEREWLNPVPWPDESDEDMRWSCRDAKDCVAFGPTMLVAAMRCYVASKLGEEVEVPDFLE